jgi:cytochrome P450
MDFPRLDDTWPFRRERSRPLLPPKRLDEIRSIGDLVDITMYDGTPVTLATRYADIRDILMSPDVSSDGRLPGFPYVSDATRANRGARPTMDRLDPPEHDEQRAMLAPSFTQKRIRELRPFVEATVNDLIDAMEASGSTADFSSQFAELIPAIIVAKLLDLPLDDAPFFLDRIHIWTNDQGNPDDIIKATADVTEYFERVIDERTGGDGTDIISGLIRNQLEPGHITRKQLLLTLHLLITAGFDTTTNAIALGTVLLLQNPDSWKELVDSEDPELVQSAVEEMLRYLSVAHSTHIRLARGDIPLGHRVIPAGKGIVAPQMAANHDPERFPDPAKFDMGRDARGHLAFGAGVHQCLGQQLARLELNVVFTLLPKRMPRLALGVPLEQLDFRPNAMVYGVTTMPVRW